MQEESATGVVPLPEEPFSLDIPSVVIYILIGLFAGVIACFIVLHNRHSKRAQVHHVDGDLADGDVDDFDEGESDEQAAARAARDRFLASQNQDDDSDGFEQPDTRHDSSDPYAHLTAARQARAKHVVKGAAKAKKDLNSSMSYPSSVQTSRGRGQQKKKKKSAWVAYTDDDTGDTYYHNQTTDEVSWDKPADLQ